MEMVFSFFYVFFILYLEKREIRQKKEETRSSMIIQFIIKWAQTNVSIRCCLGEVEKGAPGVTLKGNKEIGKGWQKERKRWDDAPTD